MKENITGIQLTKTITEIDNINPSAKDFNEALKMFLANPKDRRLVLIFHDVVTIKIEAVADEGVFDIYCGSLVKYDVSPEKVEEIIFELLK